MYRNLHTGKLKSQIIDELEEANKTVAALRKELSNIEEKQRRDTELLHYKCRYTDLYKRLYEEASASRARLLTDTEALKEARNRVISSLTSLQLHYEGSMRRVSEILLAHTTAIADLGERVHIVVRLAANEGVSIADAFFEEAQAVTDRACRGRAEFHRLWCETRTVGLASAENKNAMGVLPFTFPPPSPPRAAAQLYSDALFNISSHLSAADADANAAAVVGCDIGNRADDDVPDDIKNVHLDASALANVSEGVANTSTNEEAFTSSSNIEGNKDTCAHMHTSTFYKPQPLGVNYHGDFKLSRKVRKITSDYCKYRKVPQESSDDSDDSDDDYSMSDECSDDSSSYSDDSDSENDGDMTDESVVEVYEKPPPKPFVHTILFGAPSSPHETAAGGGGHASTANSGEAEAVASPSAVPPGTKRARSPSDTCGDAYTSADPATVAPRQQTVVIKRGAPSAREKCTCPTASDSSNGKSYGNAASSAAALFVTCSACGPPPGANTAPASLSASAPSAPSTSAATFRAAGGSSAALPPRTSASASTSSMAAAEASAASVAATVAYSAAAPSIAEATNHVSLIEDWARRATCGHLPLPEEKNGGRGHTRCIGGTVELPRYSYEVPKGLQTIYTEGEEGRRMSRYASVPKTVIVRRDPTVTGPLPPAPASAVPVWPFEHSAQKDVFRRF